MNSTESESYFVRVNPHQVIGPLRIDAVRAMVRSNKINHSSEISTDKISWTPLRTFLDSHGLAGSNDSFHRNDPGNSFQREPAWNFSATPDPHQQRSSYDDNAHGFASYDADNVALPGRPAPLPGRSQNSYPLPDHLELEDAPLPGRSAELPGRPLNAPLPGAPVPFPGTSAPLPGTRTSTPHQPQHNLNYLETPYPGAQYSGYGEHSASQATPFAHDTIEQDRSTYPPESYQNSGHPNNISDGKTAFAGAYSPDDNQDDAQHRHGQTFLGKPTNYAKDSNVPNNETSLLDDLGYRVDDLFTGENPRGSLFSSVVDAKGRTVLGAAATPGPQSGDSSTSSEPYDVWTPPVNPLLDYENPLEQSKSSQFGAEKGPQASYNYSSTALDQEAIDRRKRLGDVDSGAQGRSKASDDSELDQDDHAPSESKTHKKRTGLLIGGLIVVALIGAAAAFVILDPLGEDEQAVTPTVAAPVEETPSNTAPPKEIDEELYRALTGGKNAKELSISAIELDNYSDYARLGQTSRAKKSEPMLLFVEALIKSRYPDHLSPDGPQLSKIASQLASATGGLDALARGAWDASVGAADAARSYVEQVSNDDPDQAYYAAALGGVGDVIALKQYLQASNSEVSKDRIDSYIQSGQRSFQHAISKNKSLPFAYYWQGRMAELIEDYPAAKKSYEETLKVQPFHIGAKSRLARILVGSGETKKAREFSDEIVSKYEQLAHPSEMSTAEEVIGEVLLLQNEGSEALAHFKKAVEYDPKNAQAVDSLLRAYEETESFQEASTFFTNSQFLDQKDVNIILANAQINSALGRASDARNALFEAEKMFPSDIRIPLQLGRNYSKDGNYTSAQALFKRVLKEEPNNIEAKLELARIAWRANHGEQPANGYVKDIELTDALRAYRTAYQLGLYYLYSNQVDLAEKWLKKAIELAPTFVKAKVELSNALAAKHKYEEALEVLNSGTDKEKGTYLITLQRARVYMESGDLTRAQKIVEGILETEPHSIEALILLGRIKTKEGAYEDAEKVLEQANSATGNSYIQERIAVGLLSEAKENYDQARVVFESTLRLNPDVKEVVYYLARANRDMGNRSKAIELYTKYIDSSSYKVPVSRAYIERGGVYFQANAYSLAKSDYKHVIESPLIQNEERAEALFGLASVAFKEKKFHQAIDYLKKSLETGIDLGEVHFRLGQAYANIGDTATAVKHLNLSKEHGFDNPEVDRLLGYAYKERGMTNEASVAFKAYIKTLDRTSQMAEIKEILRQLDTL